MVLTVKQTNWDGKGNDRTFTYYPDKNTLSAKMYNIAQAFNMHGGRVKVELDGEDITQRVTDMKY